MKPNMKTPVKNHYGKFLYINYSVPNFLGAFFRKYMYGLMGFSGSIPFEQWGNCTINK